MYNFRINFKMLKTFSSPKSTKVLSKINLHPKDLNINHTIYPIQSESTSQLARLQTIIHNQITQRIKSQKNILNMIRHLQITKKSKLPSKPHIQIINKLGTAKIQKECQHQQQYRNLVQLIKTTKEQDLNINKLKFEQIKEQITNQLNLLSYIKADIKEIKNTVQDNKNDILQLKENLTKLNTSETQLRFNQRFGKIKEQIKSIMEQKIDIFIQKQMIFLSKVDDKIEQRIGNTEQCIKRCFLSLNNVQKTASSAFQTLENQIKIASRLIIQTKTSIQQTFYNSFRSRDKLDSQSSIDLNFNRTNNVKDSRKNYNNLQHIDKRVQISEKRMDLIH